MAEPVQQTEPPKLRATSEGAIDPNSMADLVEWFLNYDERTARMRLSYVNELFLWKQADDEANGIGIYPFENAEARFAIGIFQALETNNSEPLLQMWITDVLEALRQSRETKTEIDHAYKMEEVAGASALEKAGRLTSQMEKRIYLTSCWLEALCTAETRVLGWIYQEIYGKPYAG
jgi:hypothetical protein